MSDTSSFQVPPIGLIDALRRGAGALPFIGGGTSPFARREPEPEMEAHHKTLVTRFILPIMVCVTLLFYAGHWSNAPIEIAAAVAGIAIAAANAFLTARDRRLRLGGLTFHSRSDAMDALRWTLNLVVFDAGLALVFRPAAGVFIVVWLVLLASAQADMFRQKYRAFVVGLGLVVGGSLLVHLHPGIPPAQVALVLFCKASLLLILALTEAHWRSASRSAALARATSAAMAEEAARVGREASLGSHVRAFSQGMGNVAAVLEHVSAVAPGEITARHLDLVRSASTFANRLSTLALGDEASFFEQRRTLSIESLLSDLELLGVREVRARGFAWQLNVKEPAGQLSFEEWNGSTLGILHALLRGAWEAHGNVTEVHGPRGGEARGDGRSMRLDVEARAGGLVFRVEGDSLRGEGPSAPRAGPFESAGLSAGLGLLLVRAECDRNGFGLEIAGGASDGPTFSLVIPASALRS